MSNPMTATGDYSQNIPSIYRDPAYEGSGATVFNSDIESIVDKAARVAQDVLPPPSEPTTRIYVTSNSSLIPIYHHYTYFPWYDPWFFSPRYQVVHHVVERPKSKEEENNETRLWVGIAFGIMTLVTSYFIGKDLKVASEANDNLDRIRHEKQDCLFRYIENYVNHPHLNKVKKAVEGEERILRRIKNDAQAGLALKISFLTASVFGVAGAVAALSPLMVAGAVGVGFVGCCMLVKVGLDNAATKNRYDAQEILQNVTELKKVSLNQRLVVVPE